MKLSPVHWMPLWPSFTELLKAENSAYKNKLSAKHNLAVLSYFLCFSSSMKSNPMNGGLHGLNVIPGLNNSLHSLLLVRLYLNKEMYTVHTTSNVSVSSE